MTTAELQAIARDITLPVGTSTGQAIALADHEPGEKLSTGGWSGIGGRTTYRAGFLVNGRQHVPVGPAFERARDVYRLVRLLNGEASAPRSAAVIPAVLPSRADEEIGEPDQLLTGAPEKSLTPADVSGVGSTPRAGASGERTPSGAPQAGVAQQPERGAPSVEGAGSTPAPRSTLRLCAGCGLPLPADARRNRRTHNAACRQAASRRAAAGTGDASSGGEAVVTVSRPSEGLRPGVVVARHVNDVVAANNPAARPDTRERPGAEPSGVTRNRSADAPRATSSDGGSPETERAIANVATPGRSQSTPDPDPRVAQDRGSSARPGLRPTPDPTSLTLGLAER